MKRQFAILFILSLAHSSYCQVMDDFSDNDFSDNPAWVASDNALWQVTSEELQSNSPTANTYWISTPSTVSLEAEWEFVVKLKFSTSGANYVDVFLMSDNADLENTLNGYFVRVGDTQDEIVLYKLSAGTSTALIDGAEGVVNSSSNNSFKIRVTRDINDNWTLFYDDDLLGFFTDAGSAMDNAISSSSYFGFLVVQSGAASPVMNHFFDDIQVTGNSFVDIIPPQLVSLTVASSNQVLLLFNEDLEGMSASTLANYSLNNGYGNPSAAAQVTATQVQLTFASDFITGDYQLVVENISDTDGNIIDPLQVEFDVFVPDEPSLRDVIITEIFADPTPSFGLPEGDFIEIFNNSDKTFDLTGWTLSDLAGEAVLPSYILAPGGYLILCSNSQVASYASFGEALGLSSFPNFNNASDKVELKGLLNQPIDLVNYEDVWYRDEEKSNGGFSLELIDPTNVCGEQDNWIASDADIGGTPGLQNSVFDTSAGATIPEVVEVRALNENEIQIKFSELLDPLSIDLSDFSINPEISLASFQVDNHTVRLVTTETLENSLEYALTIQNLDDCTGNTIPATAVAFELVTNPALAFKDVIINEIMANPNEETDVPNAEYLELYNTTSSDLNLEGWQFSDATNSSVLPFYILPSAGYVLLTNNANVELFSSSIPVVGLVSFPTLNNSGDSLTLRTENGVLLDSVNYSSSWYRSSIKDDGGFSLELIDPEDECSDDLNWIATEDPSGGTPGTQNSVFNSLPDNRGPNLISAFGISPDSIMLEFDELLDEESIETAIYDLSNNLLVNEVSSSDLKTVFILLSQNSLLQSGRVYTISISNLTDCPGNLIEENSASFSLIESAEPNDMLLNEILFNPRSGGVDFVEIYNNSDKFINLKGWKLANGEVINDTLNISTTRTIAEQNSIIAPKTYRAINSDMLVLKDQYPKSVEKNFMEISSLPSYPDDQGIVILLNQNDSIFDFFQYSEDFHASIITDEEGVSLERISFEQQTNDAQNWFSAAESEDFATPGYQNSQLKGSLINTGSIIIDPPIITPDGDGLNDFTTINYIFDKAGYVLTVKVMDLTGKTVKVIAENDFLSFSGFYTWDGAQDNGEILRIGYYIIYVEAFHSDGDIQKFKEKIVIGTRF